MGHGLLHARIFPLEPGRERTVVVRFQSVAPREGDALRIDYFRGGAPGTTNVRDGGDASFTLSYRQAPELGAPFSPTHQLDVADRDGRRVVTVRGDARDVTLLVPVRARNEARDHRAQLRARQRGWIHAAQRDAAAPAAEPTSFRATSRWCSTFRGR